MADNNKAVGPLAAAKLVSLIKAETAKKYDKTGGKIDGSADITGGLKVGGSSEFFSSIEASSEISSDMLLMAPIVALYDPATEESISFGVSGENAAKVTSPVSGGGVQYARLAVGTPIGDNDAATKAYVDNHAAGYEVITVTSTNVSDLGYDAEEGATKYTVFFDASFDSILANLAANKPMKFNITLPDSTGGFPVSFTTGYVSALGNSLYLFTGTLAGAPIVLSINALGAATIYMYGDYLPEPNPDDSDDGKVLAVNKHKWEMKKAVVDDALSDTSTNPVQNKVVKAALDGKASTAVATQTANGLMSAADKTKLDSIDSVCYDIYAKIGAAYTHDSVYKYGCTVSHTFAEINTAVHAGKTPRVLLVDNIDNPSDTRIICPLSEYDTSRSEGGYYFDAPGLVGVSGSGRIYIDENGAMYTCSAGELPAVDANQDGKYLTIDGGMWTYRRPDVATTAEPGFMSAEDKAKLDGVDDGANKTIVDAALDAASTNPVQNKAVKTALDGKAGTAVATTSANGLMSAADKTKLDGVEDGANKTTVDAALDAASENPVQNKAVKAALDGKLSTLGGEISGHLRVGLTVSAEGSVSVGRTSADTGIHFEKAASDAGRISHGSDPMTGVSPIARLKVASPTEDDDAATKKYVDGRAVRYDAKQTLTSDQKLIACSNIGAVNEKHAWMEGEVVLLPRGADGAYTINITPSEKSNDYTLTLDAGPENVPVYVAGLETPTDAQTDYAANVAFVKAKIAEVAASGGVTVDTAMSDTSTNPVQNKTIKQYVDGHAVSLPLTLTYANGQATGAAYTDIRKAIERGRQIKLSVANTPDIIASKVKNETGKSVLSFTNIDVGGDTVNISQYTVTAQESGMTVHVKSYEIAQ